MSEQTGHSLSQTEIKRRLQEMDNEAFEYFLADLWRRHGWNAEVSQKSRDKSLDVLVEKENPYHQRHAIQAKRYQAGNRVGGPKISEYASLRDQFDADAPVVVATSGFTEDARERAETLNVKLIDGDDLAEMVETAEAHDLIREYSHTNRIQTPGRAETNESWITVTASASTDTGWFTYAGYGGAGYVMTLFVTAVFTPADGSFLDTATIVGWLLTGVCMCITLYIDMVHVRLVATDWSPSKWILYLTPVFPLVGLPYYWSRRRSVSVNGIEYDFEIP